MTELDDIINESVGQEDDCEPPSFTARIEMAQKAMDRYDAQHYPHAHEFLQQRVRNLLDARREANNMEQRYSKEALEFWSSDLYRDESRAARKAKEAK